MRRDVDLTPERREADPAARPPRAGRSAPGSRRSRVRFLLPVGIVLAVVVAAMGVPPTMALGAVIEDANDTAGEEPSEDSVAGPSLADAPELDAESTVDGLTSTLDETLGEVTDPIAPLPDPLDEDEPSEDDGGKRSDPPEEVPEEEPAEEPDEEPAGDEDAEDDEEEPAPVPARTAAVLTHLRSFDGGGTAPVLDVQTVSFLASPIVDYVDVPLGPRTTRDVIEALESVGASEDTIAEVLAPFPVAGLTRYSNDWGAPRHTPSFHAHKGTDLFASRGTPVIAAFDGVISKLGQNTAIGGNSVHLTAPDGTYLYYAHLDGFGPGIREGTLVDAGDVLGYVGDSGNARGTPPHLHFEVHPGGGEAVPPLPYLDGWLADARAEVQQLTQNPGGGGPVAASLAPPSNAGPAFGAFENAASERTPRTATLMLVVVLVGLGVTFRQRQRFAGMLASVTGTVAPVLGKIRPGLDERVMRSSSADAKREPAAPLDVLALFLAERGGDDVGGGTQT